jgi:hypothetical protein
MEIAAGIGVALSNALQIEEIQKHHIQELKRLQALAATVPARCMDDDESHSNLRAENAHLKQLRAEQHASILKLHQQARTLTKCASRALELLIRSRGSSAANDPEILQLRKCLRKCGVAELSGGNRSDGTFGLHTESSPTLANETLKSLVSDKASKSITNGGDRVQSQVPAHHAKRRKSESKIPNLEVADTDCGNVMAFASDLRHSKESGSVRNVGSVAENDKLVTSLPIPLDDADDLFDDPISKPHVQQHLDRAEVRIDLNAANPATLPPALARSDLCPTKPNQVCHRMPAQPCDNRMKFAVASTSGGARVDWDATNTSDDFVVDPQESKAAEASLRPPSAVRHQITELPPAIEKPQNFIQVVRGGARDKLPGHGCKQCDAFYSALESALPPGQHATNLCDGSRHGHDARIAVANIRDNASRHRAIFRKQDSPEDYWTTKFKD